MTVGDRIKQKRIELGLSQDELAERMGYASKSAVSRAENSGDDIGLKRVEAFANVFGCTPSELMGWVDMDEISERVDDFKNTMEKVHRYEAMKLYYKYLAATPKTRKMIDMLLEEGE